MGKVRGNGWITWAVAAAFVGWYALRPTADGAPRVFCSETQAPAPGTVVMLATSWCPYCAKARAFLGSRGARWCEYDTETSARGLQLYEQHRGRGVPIIIAGDQVLHGYDAAALARLVPAPRPGI